MCIGKCKPGEVESEGSRMLTVQYLLDEIADKYVGCAIGVFRNGYSGGSRGPWPLCIAKEECHAMFISLLWGSEAEIGHNAPMQFGTWVTGRVFGQISPRIVGGGEAINVLSVSVGCSGEVCAGHGGSVKLIHADMESGDFLQDPGRGRFHRFVRSWVPSWEAEEVIFYVGCKQYLVLVTVEKVE